MTLGERIAALRGHRGWSQRELARRSGVRQSLLSELERGMKTDTTGRTLVKLARALSVSTDTLLGTFDAALREP
jgi:transcriptional regulator with XRE-family HTH domain